MTIFRSASLWLLAALLAAALLLAACQPPKGIAPLEEPKPGPLQRASKALNEKDFEKARSLYFQALQKKDLSREHQVLAWQGLARSALETGHLQMVRKSLRQWRILNPDAADTWAWQKIEAGVIRRSEGAGAYTSHLEGLLDKDRPWTLAFESGKALTEFYLERKEPEKFLTTLARLNKLAEESEQRGELMDFTRGMASDMPQEKRAELLRAVPQEESDRFPAVFLRWKQALQRFQQDEADWRETWKDFAAILENTEAVYRTRLGKDLRRLEEKHGRPAPGVVLLLPMSGGYGNIGWKIARGADAAQWNMSKQGRPVRLKVVNTRSSDWMKRLKQLTATYSIVGGPIRQSIWEEIHEAGLHRKLPFFTFRSNLRHGTEGKDAYRFFPGRKDQVEALLDVSRNKLGISSFGILYPKSGFGRSMARSFWNATVAENAKLNALDHYIPQSIVSYEDKVADYLHVPENYTEEEQAADSANATQNATLIPKPDFEAVFIPDSFSRARILIPEFFYFNQTDLVFLGPAMWGQQIKRISGLDMRYFNLTLLASPWWPDNPVRQLKILRQTLEKGVQEGPDFWVGLGYDFLRFAPEIAPQGGNGVNEELSQKLARMSGFDWTMAPISWNEKGRASQDLFVLRPVADGVRRVRSDRMETRLKKAREMQRKWRARVAGNATKAGNATAQKQADEP